MEETEERLSWVSRVNCVDETTVLVPEGDSFVMKGDVDERARSNVSTTAWRCSIITLAPSIAIRSTLKTYATTSSI
jgi:hypothetical protein